MAEAPTYRSLQPQLPSPIAPSAAHASPPPAGSFHPPQAVHVPPPMAYYPPPSQGIAAPGVMGRWSTGLCDCFEDAELCCVTCWCPCITFGQIAEIVDRGSTSCGLSGALYGIILGVSFSLGIPGIQFIYSCSYRSKMRAQYNLPEEPCMDCCVHCCCECCALCQEYRELRNHGYDMNIDDTLISLGGTRTCGGYRPLTRSQRHRRCMET